MGAMRVTARRLVGSAALLAWLAGCAATQPKPAAHTPPPAEAPSPAVSGTGAEPGTRVGTTASGGSIVVREPAAAPAVVDSTPSEDALAVLNTIPEPLGRATEPESVPVPAPTEPLGARPSASATLPDSLIARPASPAPVVATGGATRPSAGSPDSCWRVQVAAPPERDRADRMAKAAESQLEVPFVVELEGGLHKVRTRDCFSSSQATALRNRAVADGFDGSFRFLRAKR